MSAVISNAGPLIALAKLNRLEVLVDLYNQVQIPQTVYHEAVTQGLARGASDALTLRLFWQQQNWPIVTVSSAILNSYTPSVTLHPGEFEVLALAQTISSSLVLLDDELARTEARRLNLNVRGTLGVLVQAYRQQCLSLNQVELLLQQIGLRTDIWMSEKLCQQVLDALKRSR